MAFDDGVFVEFEEGAGNLLKEGKLFEFFDADGVPGLASTVRTTLLLVSAPVGQETMHSPHETQLDVPMGRLRSKAMPAL